MIFAVLTALLLNGMLAGMALDQTLKQLPARRRIGAVAYSRYSRAADLKNGVPLYVSFGLGAPLSCVTLLFLSVSRWGWQNVSSVAALCAVIASLGQLALTAFAAPTDFLQRKCDPNDEAGLAKILDRFAALNGWRTIFILVAFAAVLWMTFQSLR